jgi:hypothetical protein
MYEDSIEPQKRVAAWYALRDAKAAMEEIIAEAARTSDARLSDKLKKWLATVTVAEKDVSNLIGELDPSQYILEIRQIAAKLRQLGKRKADEIAGKLERADSMLMDA